MCSHERLSFHTTPYFYFLRPTTTSRKLLSNLSSPERHVNLCWSSSFLSSPSSLVPMSLPMPLQTLQPLVVFSSASSSSSNPQPFKGFGKKKDWPPGTPKPTLLFIIDMDLLVQQGGEMKQIKTFFEMVKVHRIKTKQLVYTVLVTKLGFEKADILRKEFMNLEGVDCLFCLDGAQIYQEGCSTPDAYYEEIMLKGWEPKILHWIMNENFKTRLLIPPAPKPGQSADMQNQTLRFGIKKDDLPEDKLHALVIEAQQKISEMSLPARVITVDRLVTQVKEGTSAEGGNDPADAQKKQPDSVEIKEVKEIWVLPQASRVQDAIKFTMMMLEVEPENVWAAGPMEKVKELAKDIPQLHAIVPLGSTHPGEIDKAQLFQSKNSELEDALLEAINSLAIF